MRVLNIEDDTFKHNDICKALSGCGIKDVEWSNNLADGIPCTGCRYCMDCPSGVEIPTVFSLYNQYALNQNKEVFDEIDATARAEQCIACGQCMEHCPQSIPIPEKMAMIAELIQS